MKSNGNHPPAKDDQAWQQAQTLALSSWDLERNKQRWAQSSRAKLVVLRAKKGLQGAIERELDIPLPQRSQVRLRENAMASCLLIHDLGGSPANMKKASPSSWDGVRSQPKKQLKRSSYDSDQRESSEKRV